MKQIDVYIRTWSLLRIFYFIGNDTNDVTKEKFLDVLKRWNLGEDSMEINFFSEEPLNKSKKSLLEEVKDYAKDLEQRMDAVVLTILLKDLNDILLVDGRLNDIEREAIGLLESIWDDKLIPIESFRFSAASDKEFLPTNSLFALGFLFLKSMKADGHIDKLELSKLRDNLSIWNNENARMILAAVNLAESSIGSKNILKMFTDEAFNENVKRSILNCIRYLKVNEYVGVRRIMYEQIMGIIKADSKVHKNENWIREKLREEWDDIEG